MGPRNSHLSKVNSVARHVFQGWQIVLEESRRSESEGLFHTVRYQNQINMRENIELSSMSQRPRVSSTKNLRRSLLRSYKEKVKIKSAKNSHGWQKAGILLPRGALAIPCHPTSAGLNEVV